MSDYYETLDIERDATQEEIREAYKTKILEVHPDKKKHNNNNDSIHTLDEVREAYKTLSNAKKREEYDNTLENEKIENEEFRDFNNMWKSLVSKVGERLVKINNSEEFQQSKATVGNMLKQFLKENEPDIKEIPKTKNIEHTVEFDLESIIRKEIRNIYVKVKRICRTCRGRGLILKGYEICKLCEGMGECATHTLRGEDESIMCPNCGGMGMQQIEDMMPCKVTCDSCGGIKYCIEKILLKIPSTSKQIIFEGQSDDKPKHIRGDIIINTKPRYNKKFRIQNYYDLLTTKNIYLSDVRKGSKIRIKNVDKTKIELNLPENCTSLDASYFRHTIPGQGLWINDHQRGNLIVDLIIRLNHEKVDN